MDFLAIFKVFGPDASAAAGGGGAGTILDSGQAPPLTPRDGISRKGKPLAPPSKTTQNQKTKTSSLGLVKSDL